MSGSAPRPPLPIVAGLTITSGARVAKLDHLLFRPNARSWSAMLETLREAGDRTSTTTRRGDNHPCQTDDLRCDHQGEIGDGYANTQVQLGGREVSVERSKPEQSTTVTQVNVKQSAYDNALINDALARAHDWSFSTGLVVQIDPAAGATITVPRTSGPLTFTCSDCAKTYVAMNPIALGIATGSYPPICVARNSKAALCGGALTRR